MKRIPEQIVALGMTGFMSCAPTYQVYNPRATMSREQARPEVVSILRRYCPPAEVDDQGFSCGREKARWDEIVYTRVIIGRGRSQANIYTTLENGCYFLRFEDSDVPKLVEVAETICALSPTCRNMGAYQYPERCGPTFLDIWRYGQQHFR